MSAIQQLITEHIDVWTAADTEKKSGRGRVSGNGNAGSVYGIKKLRELILELALRGKLVPQDANDEPACDLLKRIQAEKCKLIAEGKLKKEKPLSLTDEGDKPFELSLGWEWVSLNEVADVIRGVTYGKADASDDPLNEYVPLLRGNNIDRVLNFDKPVYVPRKLLNESQFVKKGDIVIAMSSGSADLVGKAAQAEVDFNGGFGAFCGVVRSFSSELLSYFTYFFQTPYYRNTVARYGKGIGINNLQKSSLVLLNLPIPPIAEQHRIVAKVDELMALCDQLETQHSNAAEAHEKLVSHLLGTLTQSQVVDDFSANWQRIAAHFDTLFTTETSIDVLKQTLLQMAVMGKLVPQDANDEPASELFKRIQAEKAKLVAEGKIKKQKALAAIADDEKTFELPKGWAWSRLGEAGITATGGTPKTSDTHLFEGNIPFIGPGQISQAGTLLDPEKYLTEDGVAQSTLADSGDVLMVCIGGSIGKTLLANKLLTFNQQINSVKPILVNSSYLNSMMNSVIFQQELLLKATGSATPIINRSKWDELLVSLPPLSEQHRIVAKLDELMALCDKLKTCIQQANQQQQTIANVLVAQVLN
jgi:type I restriction enzyme S subunit